MHDYNNIEWESEQYARSHPAFLRIVRGHSPDINHTTAGPKALFVPTFTTAAYSYRCALQAQPQNMVSRPIRWFCSGGEGPFHVARSQQSQNVKGFCCPMQSQFSNQYLYGWLWLGTRGYSKHDHVESSRLQPAQLAWHPSLAVQMPYWSKAIFLRWQGASSPMGAPWKGQRYRWRFLEVWLPSFGNDLSVSMSTPQKTFE